MIFTVFINKCRLGEQNFFQKHKKKSYQPQTFECLCMVQKWLFLKTETRPQKTTLAELRSRESKKQDIKK